MDVSNIRWTVQTKW